MTVTTLSGTAPTQINFPDGSYVYYRKLDDLRSGDIVYRDDEEDWHVLECDDCGIQPMEGDNDYICPCCNAIFR